MPPPATVHQDDRTEILMSDTIPFHAVTNLGKLHGSIYVWLAFRTRGEPGSPEHEPESQTGELGFRVFPNRAGAHAQEASKITPQSWIKRLRTTISTNGPPAGCNEPLRLSTLRGFGHVPLGMHCDGALSSASVRNHTKRSSLENGGLKLCRLGVKRREGLGLEPRKGAGLRSARRIPHTPPLMQRGRRPSYWSK